MDSHLTTMKVSPDVQLILGELRRVVERDIKIFGIMESKLMGPLMATVCESSLEKEKLEGSGYGKMWNRLVDHANVGVGEYQVEVLEL
jgi:hypothetical protein